jgi:hypothetical protein
VFMAAGVKVPMHYSDYAVEPPPSIHIDWWTPHCCKAAPPRYANIEMRAPARMAASV